MEAIDTLAIFGLPSPVATSVHSGVSPSNSSAEDFDFDIQDDAFSSMLGNTDNDDQSSLNEDGTKKRGRRPPSTAAKRATHNAVERARRESLNDRFMELAQTLPNMAMSKRPSKNSIVEHAIEYVNQAKAKDQAMIKENASLLAELNALRSQLGMPARPALEPIVEAPTGKPPSKRPSTIQNAPSKPKAAPVVVAPTPIVTAVANQADVSPRTVSAPAVMPSNPYMQPAAFDWTTAQFDTFNVHSFDPSVYAVGTQTGGSAYNPGFAWQTSAPFAYAPTPSIPGLA